MAEELDLDRVSNTIFSQKRFIGVADVVLGFSMGNPEFFTVADVDPIYRASRYAAGQIKSPVGNHLRDMVALRMVEVTANIDGSNHYGLVDSPLWGVVGAYSAAMDQMFPELNEG